ncbi:glycosyltransferase involved in cell wall biosynthesis [Novosphingobium chloroacetimidivorans]|uniref:Glycosyltransferase involved in cell wall biosynthesis n=1 Tax=Novosphingobium chloroacetimidivorans TaxID=1428314 RepID=A0A7W7K6P2_9SPHN|nr:glycosyltransferase family 4 protein [Novosphingobium chloroacetimidivorans]MBB4857245.1 glycosyltransferase involved in cell wall biosynthesis [Novosphingobium chloroacetimidivorans]
MSKAAVNAATEPDPLAATPASIGSRRPRVMQVVTKLDLGGAESVAVDLVGALHESVDFAMFAVFALDAPTRVGRDMARRLAGWNVPVFTGTAGHFKKGGALVAAWRLAKAVRRFRADVVHLHTEVPELTCAIATVLSPRLARVQVLRTVHNCELWIAWGKVGRWVTQRLARGSAIAVSLAAAQADAAIPTRMPRAPAPVVYNGVAPPPIAPPRTRGPYRLLFAARLVPAKGSDLLPRILHAAHARTARRDVEVTIAGTGPQEAQLGEALHGVAPGWTVRMVPPIEQLGAHLGEWDGVLMPSRFEGLGLLAIEAFMAGVPLAATDAPGLSEVLPQDYPYCAQVDDAEALGAVVARMIDDPAGARSHVAPLRAAMIARFSPTVMADGYLSAYRAAMAPTA